MSVVELIADHCGLPPGRVMNVTPECAEAWERQKKAKILQEDPSVEAIAMVESSQCAPPKPEPPKQVAPIVCPHCQKEYTPPDQDFSSMTSKATTEPPRNKAVKSKDTRRKGPTNVTTSANLDEGNKSDGKSDD